MRCRPALSVPPGRACLFRFFFTTAFGKSGPNGVPNRIPGVGEVRRLLVPSMTIGAVVSSRWRIANSQAGGATPGAPITLVAAISQSAGQVERGVLGYPGLEG